MIDHLRGRLVGGGKDFVVVECAGIGFRVHVSAATRKDLPRKGSCIVRTHLHFREEADLYGFSSETERRSSSG
jgi:Holliday junction DNA helicase RuvA